MTKVNFIHSNTPTNFEHAQKYLGASGYTNSSIENGGTRPFSYVMDYKAIFQHVEFLMLLYFDIFLWLRCEVVFPMHMTMVWDLANGAGIPALSDAIDVCVSKHQSALIRGDGDSSSTAGLKARRPRPPSK